MTDLTIRKTLRCTTKIEIKTDEDLLHLYGINCHIKIVLNKVKFKFPDKQTNLPAFMHTIDKQWKCTPNSDSARHKDQLKSPLVTLHHEGERERNFKCATCNYSTSWASNLRKHNRIHGTERTYKCPFCKYAAKLSDTLHSHLKTHIWEKPFNCEFCNYNTSRKQDLTRHMHTHTGEKPYACATCNFTCTHSSALRSHIKSHTGEKPYACTQCNYSPAFKANLNRHVTRKHSAKPPERKFGCSLCPKTFLTRSEVYQHIKTHTKEKPHPCQYCKKEFGVLSTKNKHENVCKLRPDGLQIKPYK